MAEVASEAEHTKHARDQLERQNVEMTKRIQEVSNDNAVLRAQFQELEHQYEQNLKVSLKNTDGAALWIFLLLSGHRSILLS